MSPAELFTIARRAGVTLTVTSDGKLTAFGARPSTELVDAIRSHKRALAAYLSTHHFTRFGDTNELVEAFIGPERPPHPLDDPEGFAAYRARELSRLDELDRGKGGNRVPQPMTGRGGKR